jgi:hypothetical protein
MIHTENPEQHQIMKEIVRLTMELKSKHASLYAHLDETPMFVSVDAASELKSMQDYRNTLAIQLKEADSKK